LIFHHPTGEGKRRKEKDVRDLIIKRGGKLCVPVLPVLRHDTLCIPAVYWGEILHPPSKYVMVGDRFCNRLCQQLKTLAQVI
jgi:hypothetical protein